jgi:hypothetical protein
MQGGVGGGVAKGGTGGGTGEESCSGIEEDSKEVEGSTFGPVVLDAQLALTKSGGMVVNIAGGDGIVVLTHGSLRG